MSKPRSIFAVVFFVFLLGMTRTAPAAAETECALNQGDFDKLQSIENNSSLDYFEEIKLELQLRKKLLGDAVRCAINDATAIKANLDQVKLNDRDAVNLQSQFSNQLDNAIGYYKLQELKIGDLGLQGSKDFAKNLSLWRSGNYEQVAKMAGNFIIWAKNQSLVEAAQNRVDQIGRSVTLLGLVYNGDGEIQDLWREVDVNFSEAKNLNQKSRNDLASATPDEALTTIKLSLDSLAKTYEKLSELVSAINKALALPS